MTADRRPKLIYVVMLVFPAIRDCKTFYRFTINTLHIALAFRYFNQGSNCLTTCNDTAKRLILVRNRRFGPSVKIDNSLE